MRQSSLWIPAAFAVVCIALPLAPLTAQEATAPHAAGTVKSTNATGLTLTTTSGQDYTVTVPATAKVMVVAPGSKDLKSATIGSLSDVSPADKVIVTGTPGDSGATLTAVRVILMKSQAIEQVHAAEDAAWAQGGGGIVRSADPATGTIVVASGLKTLTVTVTPATIIRRYSGDSVRFADAQVSTVASIRAGDQLRVRGAKSPDGRSITADELVTGSFHNYSGLIASIDAAAGTITLKDLATKKTVSVAVTTNSDVHRIPAMLAARVALQMKGGTQAAGGASAAPADAAGGTRRAGMDLSQMLSRLPAETLAGLKVGDAVMIVATSPSADASTSNAITLLAGVDPILSASPSGQSATLSPWSVGGDSGMSDPGAMGGSPQRVATPQ
jgi:hypothetical protein